MKTQDYIALEEQYGAHNYHPLDVVIEKAEGVWVYDVDGNNYLDCLSAYSAVNQGHVHPKILEAMLEQAKKVTLTSRAFRNDQLPLFYKELSEMTGYEMSLPMNSGAEAVETAIKLARKWAYRVKGVPRHQAEIIVCAGNFHGRTTTIISFSTEPSYRDDFGPFTPGFVTIPYGDLDALEKAITPNTAACLIEPIQGEGGVIIPPAVISSRPRICVNGTMFSSSRTRSRRVLAGPGSCSPAITRMSALTWLSWARRSQADFIPSAGAGGYIHSRACSSRANTAQLLAGIPWRLPLPAPRCA